MSTREIPLPWSAVMDRERLVAPDGRPSLRALARKADISVETVRRLVWGVGVSAPDTIDAVAAALREDPLTVSRWAGVARQTTSRWEPPAEAVYLSARQQDALSELIRSMVQTDQLTEAQKVDARAAEEMQETRASRSSTPIDHGKRRR